MQYFNKYNSEVEYIKDILRANYIPTVRIFNSKTNIQPQSKESSIQTYDDGSMETIAEETNKNVFKNETIILDSNVNIGNDSNSTTLIADSVRRLQEYKFGQRYLNYTTNYISNKNYYDSDLHEWLGRYLRAYRDYYHIDVMNFYNCYSCRTFSDISLPIPSAKSATVENGMVFNDANVTYKLTAFPILWDTKYKVKFYTASIPEVKLQAVYYTGNTIIGAAEYDARRENTEELEETFYTPITHEVHGQTEFYVTIGSEVEDCMIEPMADDDSAVTEYEKIAKEKERILKQRFDRQRLLYLFMEYPSTIDCPIVVLEQPKFTNAINNELLNLTFFNKKQVAFTDILLEYLTGNVLTLNTQTYTSIHHLQQIVSSNAFYEEYGVGGPNYIGIEQARNTDTSPKTYKFPTGIFDEYLHQILYKAFFNNGRDAVIKGAEEPVKNFIGFVDSDIEKRLNTMASKYNLNVEI